MPAPKASFDTSAIVASAIEDHPHHVQAIAAVQAVQGAACTMRTTFGQVAS
jgi:hypothetical protein